MAEMSVVEDKSLPNVSSVHSLYNIQLPFLKTW